MRLIKTVFGLLSRGTSGPALAILIAITIASASKFWDSITENIEENIGVTEILLYSSAFSICLFTTFSYAFYRLRKEPPHNLPRKKDNLTVVRVSTLEQIKHIQESIVPEIFGEATPPPEEIYKIFQHNSRITIALYSDDERRYVGFASIWPITEEAASLIISGKLSEEQITVKHILPASENQSARYALIPGIAVLDPHSIIGAKRGLKLIFNFRNFIIEEFLVKEDRCIDLLAFAYSEDGKDWCESIGMKIETITHHAPTTPLPLYRKQICARDMRSFV